MWVSIEGREMDQSLDPCLPAGLGNHPRSLLVHLSVLKVPASGMSVGDGGGEGEEGVWWAHQVS